MMYKYIWYCLRVISLLSIGTPVNLLYKQLVSHPHKMGRINWALRAGEIHLATNPVGYQTILCVSYDRTSQDMYTRKPYTLSTSRRPEPREHAALEWSRSPGHARCVRLLRIHVKGGSVFIIQCIMIGFFCVVFIFCCMLVAQNMEITWKVPVA